jgi:small-conductance mechanosensitive channel
MNPPLHLDTLFDALRPFATLAALTEAGVLLACLAASWLVCWLARRSVRIEGVVIFGRRTVDGVLFPVLALVFALLGEFLLSGVMKVAVLKVAVPILSSLVAIRLGVRVLSYAFPNWPFARVLERTISWLAWIAAVLWITGIGPAILDELDDYRLKIGGANVSVRTMIEGSLTAAVVMVLALWLSAAVEKKLVHGTGNDLSLRKVAANLVRVVLLFLGLIFAMSAVGINLTALSVLGGAAGVGIGFGLQKIAANYVSGFVILAERSLRIGDVVKVDNFEGRISDIRTRYTVVRASSGREAIVPNEMLITQRVENASLATPESQVLISVVVQVAWGTDVRGLTPKLQTALASHTRVLATPTPVVQLTNFVPNGMELTIKYWLTDPNTEQDRVKSEVNLAILDVLSGEKVEVPGPPRVVLQGLRATSADDATG